MTQVGTKRTSVPLRRGERTRLQPVSRPEEENSESPSSGPGVKYRRESGLCLKGCRSLIPEGISYGRKKERRRRQTSGESFTVFVLTVQMTGLPPFPGTTGEELEDSQVHI